MAVPRPRNRAAQDTTLINHRALKARVRALEVTVAELKAWVDVLRESLTDKKR